MGTILEGTGYIILFVTLYFEVLLLISFMERYPKLRRMTYALPRRLPSVAVIVPCYNEERTVAGTIRSLLELDYPQNKLSILVVDDGSTDNTAAIARRFEKYPQVRVFRKENGGKHTALNVGLENTSAELVGCLDADSFVTPQALKTIIPYFEDPKTMAVTPAIKVINPRNIIELIQKTEYGLSVFIRRVFAFINAQFVTPGPFSIFRRSVFDEVGPFRFAHNTEDLEMCLRLQSRHYVIQNAHQAYVFTRVPNTLHRLFRQRVRWTHGFLKNAFDYRRLFFRPSYGSLGTVVLPIASFSIFGALYFFGLMTVGFAQEIIDTTVRIQTVGITFPNALSLPSWFFINTDVLLLLVTTIVVLTFGIVLIGKHLASERRLISIDTFLFLFLYGFIAPLWLAASVVRVTFSRGTNWQQEHEQ